MKWISGCLVMLTLSAPSFGRAQDAATEEQLKQLNGRLDQLADAQEAQRKRIEELAQKIEGLRAEMNKPAPSYALVEDLKRVINTVTEVDRKRVEDTESTRAKVRELINVINKLSDKLSAAPPPPRPRPTPPPPQDEPPVPDKTTTPEASGEFITHKVEAGETLSAIIAACKEQHIKVTKKQILDANPGLRENSLRIGAKIRIPKPPPE